MTKEFLDWYYNYMVEWYRKDFQSRKEAAELQGRLMGKLYERSFP